MENGICVEIYLLILSISIFFAYLSYRKAVFKYKYSISMFKLLIPTLFINSFLIFIGGLRGESIFFYSLIVLLNIVCPYLAIRKVSNYRNQI